MSTSQYKVSSWWALLALAVASLTVVGCSQDNYYCDGTGCYSCDGLSCRTVAPPVRTTCTSDSACGAGSYCSDVGCVVGCTSTSTCPQGTVCTSGSCLSPTETLPTPHPGSCQFNNECGAGFACVNQNCVAQCSSSSSTMCPTGTTCNATSGSCVTNPVTMCTSNSECRNQMCINGACHDACTMDSQCGTGRICRSGVCAVDTSPHPFCTNDSGCQPGHPCRGGVCRTTCTTSNECARLDVQFQDCVNGYCETANEATSDCMTQSDCNAGQSCTDGVCRNPS